MHIISESVLMLLTENYQNQSTLFETTACQIWRVFLRHSVNNTRRVLTVVCCRWLRGDELTRSELQAGTVGGLSLYDLAGPFMLLAAVVSTLLAASIARICMRRRRTSLNYRRGAKLVMIIHRMILQHFCNESFRETCPNHIPHFLQQCLQCPFLINNLSHFLIHQVLCPQYLRYSSADSLRIIYCNLQHKFNIYTTLFTINGSTKSNNIQQQHIIHIQKNVV